MNQQEFITQYMKQPTGHTKERQLVEAYKAWEVHQFSEFAAEGSGPNVFIANTGGIKKPKKPTI